MKISDNTFSQKAVTTGSSGSKKTTTTGGAGSKKKITRGIAAWEGVNLRSDALGFDDLFSGKAFGVGELGGISHFKARSRTRPSH